MIAEKTGKCGKEPKDLRMNNTAWYNNADLRNI